MALCIGTGWLWRGEELAGAYAVRITHLLPFGVRRTTRSAPSGTTYSGPRLKEPGPMVAVTLRGGGERRHSRTGLGILPFEGAVPLNYLMNHEGLTAR